MKRLIFITIIKMLAKATLFTTIAGFVVVVIGNKNHWETSLAYGNAFFIAGCLMIVAGASSRLGASQEWNNFRFIFAESFRNMSSSERANYILNASSSVNLLILGLLSGIMLILISVIVTKTF